MMHSRINPIKLSLKQLLKCLMNRGDEKYSREEAEALIAEADAIDGQIDYKLFVEFSSIHEVNPIQCRRQLNSCLSRNAGQLQLVFSILDA